MFNISRPGLVLSAQASLQQINEPAICLAKKMQDFITCSLKYIWKEELKIHTQILAQLFNPAEQIAWCVVQSYQLLSHQF